jgi:FK506-binding protein 4/5
LIPDNDAEEKESNDLKISCHLNQSLCFMKMKRYQECLKELQDVLYKLDKTNIKALYRKVQVYEILGSTKEANEAIKFYEGIANRTEKDDKLFNALKVRI